MRMCAIWMLILGATVPPVSAHLTAEVLPFYNSERTANGLPSVNQINAPEQVGCANHLNYMSLNGGGLEHGETPGNPGFTPEGNYENGAGGSEVLAQVQWSSSSDPWEMAPIHAFLMFDPTVISTGYADNADFACQRMWSSAYEQGAPSAAPLTFYAWTFMHGRSEVPYEENAAESPYTPQQLIGIPATQTTGPNLMVYSAGGLGTPQSVTLTAAHGFSVPVGLVSVNSSSSVGQGSEWFRGGAIIIPNSPLSPSSTYTAEVTWSDQGQTQIQTFTFTTAAHPNSVQVNPTYVFTHSGRRTQMEMAVVESQAPNPTLRITGARTHALAPKLHHIGSTHNGVSHYDSPTLKLSAGSSYRFCVKSGGAGTGYVLASACHQFKVARQRRTRGGSR
jgi:hypothetical protein